MAYDSAPRLGQRPPTAGCSRLPCHAHLNLAFVAGRTCCETLACRAFSACAEMGDVTRGGMADVGATGRKVDFGAVDSSHHLPAGRAHAALQQEPVEADAFVPKRVTFINADHDGRE